MTTLHWLAQMLAPVALYILFIRAVATMDLTDLERGQ
jgi:hypothetical protein